MGYLSLRQPERQKDSPRWGCSRFYTASTWHIRWHSTIYTIYWKFGIKHMKSCPGQWPLAISFQQLLIQPVAAIRLPSAGCNQNPVGIDYLCTGYSGAERSGLHSTFTYGWKSQNIEGVSLFVYGYHWLPLPTIDLVGDNKEFEVWCIFLRSYTHCNYGWWSQNIKGASLFVHGYHWLPQATVHLMGDNREFEVWCIFWDLIHFICGWWS